MLQISREDGFDIAAPSGSDEASSQTTRWSLRLWFVRFADNARMIGRALIRCLLAWQCVMRIGHSIFLVGAIPIVTAATIAVAAVVLLAQADRARSGATLAGDIYRNAMAASAARNQYLSAQPGARQPKVHAFSAATDALAQNLHALSGIVTEPRHRQAITDAEGALDQLTERMESLVAVTEANDQRLAGMAARAARLIGLADEARRRQHRSNSELAASLGASDQRLRLTRRVVDQAYVLRTVASDLERRWLNAGGNVPGGRMRLELARLSNGASALADSLEEAGDMAARATLQAFVADDAKAFDPGAAAGTTLRDVSAEMIAWIDGVVKVYKTESDALQDELAELVTYSVEASETDQATQNIATEMMRVAEETDRALESPDFAGIDRAGEASRELSGQIASLPIPPLIQTEMLDASTAWRGALATTAEDLKHQSRLVAEMEAAGNTMVAAVGSLNDLLTSHAEASWTLARNLLIGAALFGLILAVGLGLVVARSISVPLRRLQREMLGLVDGTHSGAIAGASRRDELGDMARATNYFVTELTRREQQMQTAKEEAHAALADLKRTQANLIQAEKLASLGQLVAGVAHEINTPLGVALTTASVMTPEVDRFAQSAESGQLTRSSLTHFAARMREGTQLLTNNLGRAANLVHSFKQVAVDQASGDRRAFKMAGWLDDLLVSLGPVLKKSGHKLEVACDDIEVDGYPGALAQVLTNLIVNALSHAFPTGAQGTLTVKVNTVGEERFVITFSDDGCGIAPEYRGRVFDPFFTTGRSAGNTGLGLHIVYNLVTGRLGGRISLESTVGHGTRFRIDLPRRAPDEPAEHNSHRPSRAAQ